MSREYFMNEKYDKTKTRQIYKSFPDAHRIYCVVQLNHASGVIHTENV